MGKDINKDIKDLRYLEWTRIRHSSGTAGSLLKAHEYGIDFKRYYKLSSYDSIKGIFGHESVNEVIADRLLTLLGIDHLNYELVHAVVEIDGEEYTTWLCSSNDFKEPGDSKMPLDDYYDLHKARGETPLSFCARMGWDRYIYEMLVVDYLILNRDRHGANIEILKKGKSGTVRPAPLFDHGLSLLCTCMSPEEIERFDPMEDYPVQSFVGSRSAFENLKLIPKSKKPKLRPIEKSDREILLGDLDGVLSDEHLDKIWKMIWSRWKIYEKL